MVKITIPNTKRKRSRDEPEQVKNSRPKPDQRTEPQPQQQQAEPVDIEELGSSEEEEDDDGGVEIISVQQQAQPSNFRKTQCPVCLEIPDVLCSTECGHLYCYDCVFAALCSTARATKTVGECSICRRKVRYDKVMYLQMRKGAVAA